MWKVLGCPSGYMSEPSLIVCFVPRRLGFNFHVVSNMTTELPTQIHLESRSTDGSRGQGMAMAMAMNPQSAVDLIAIETGL